MPNYKPITAPKTFPVDLMGELAVADVTGFVKDEVLTGGTSGATSVIKKIDTTRNLLHVNKIVGLYADAETVTGGTSSASDTVATNGFDLSITDSGVLRTNRSGASRDRIRTELLTAIRGQATMVTDVATAPTFGSPTATYSAAAHMVTDDVFTVTVTASEAVNVDAGAYVTVTFNGGTARHAVFDAAASTGTSLKFKYTVVAGDVATSGQIVVGTSIVGNVYDAANVRDFQYPFSAATTTFGATTTTGISAN